MADLWSNRVLILAFVVLSVFPMTGRLNARSLPDSPCSSIVANAKAKMQTDSDAARIIANDAEKCADHIPDQISRRLTLATSQWLQGEAFLRINDVRHAANAIAMAKANVLTLGKAGDDLLGEILLTSGGVHQSKGEVALALQDYQRSYEFFQRRLDNRGRAIALVTMAGLYNDANDPSHSLIYLEQARDVYRVDESLSVSIYNNIANNLQDLGRFRESEGQYRKALAIADHIGGQLLRARILGNIARVRLKAGDVAGAESVIRKGYALTNGGEAAIWRPQFVGLAAQAALQRHDYARAASLIGERFEGVDPATTTLTFREAHETAYEAYRATGDTKQALIHLAALKRLDDKATALATSSNTALMAARFDFANQALKIAKLQAQDLRRNVAAQQARAQTQRTLTLGAAGGGAVVIAMLAFALVTRRRARRKVDAANADLAVTNESLARALAAKTEFLATTSHEIRTPLNGILGMTQVMLADPKLARDVRDRIGIVHDAGNTMRLLVDDILDVAKMESGKLTLETVAFDLADTMAGAVRMWDQQAHAKGIGFAADLSACPDRIEGDPARVRQIVYNLLSNALKFTVEGDVRLRVAPDGDDRYAIVVSDSGIGIPADKQEAIFESFRQADAGTTRRFGGTGLGLAICRNLARAMGGDIRVESVEGQGATFVVTLPLVRAVSATTCPEVEGQAGPALLIVDRNPITRSMFRTLLAPHVATVAFAGSAAEAQTCVSAGAIDHVLLDEGTMREAEDPVAAIVALADAAGAATVTVLWSAADEEGRDRLARYGVTRVVAKPVTGQALVAAIFGETPIVAQAA